MDYYILYNDRANIFSILYLFTDSSINKGNEIEKMMLNTQVLTESEITSSGRTYNKSVSQILILRY
jgi:hypothetical protein